jgi:hemophore-related protein
MAQGYLRQFLASPPPQRQALAQQALAVPGASQQVGLIVSLASTCNNY